MEQFQYKEQLSSAKMNKLVNELNDKVDNERFSLLTIKGASVANNVLTLEKTDGTSIEFKGDDNSVKTINNSTPDENGNINVSVMTPEQQEGLDRILNLESKLSELLTLKRDVEILKSILSTEDKDLNNLPDGEDRLRNVEDPWEEK